MKRIINFLVENGYTEHTEEGAENRSFFKEGLCSIDLGEEEIFFIGDKGDFLSIPLNYYALLGALIDLRQLSFNYKP